LDALAALTEEFSITVCTFLCVGTLQIGTFAVNLHKLFLFCTVEQMILQNIFLQELLQEIIISIIIVSKLQAGAYKRFYFIPLYDIMEKT